MRGKAEDEAETPLHKSLALARRQGARSLELRTATSLARHWHRRCKDAEANNLLSPIQNWFTAGFQTRDLRDAKEVIENLS
jgi:hypothetical protein